MSHLIAIFLQFVDPTYAFDEGMGLIENLVFVEKQNGAESEQVLEVTLTYQDLTTGVNTPFVMPDTSFGTAGMPKCLDLSRTSTELDV